MSGIANLAGMGTEDAPSAVLARLLESRGWTKERLAHESGVSVKTVSRIFKGETKDPDLKTRLALAEALEVDESVFAPPRPSYTATSPTQATLARIERKLDDLLSRLPEYDADAEKAAIEEETEERARQAERNAAESARRKPGRQRQGPASRPPA